MVRKNVLLQMKGIHKTFPGVKALKNVDFTLREGEIHGLMGENGAGKSTLIKVLTGVEKLDQGTITLNGKKVCPRSPLDAQQMGISTVYQEINLCPNLTVAENLTIGRQPTKFGALDWQEMIQKAKKAMKALDLDIDVTRQLDSYSVAIQQMVAIARSLDFSAKVLVLDEPTSSLDQSEVEQLIKIMFDLKGKGMGIIFITHFLEQLYQVSDRATVLRNGELVGEYELDKLPKVELIGKMIGKDYRELKQYQDNKVAYRQPGEPLLIAKSVGKEGSINPFNLKINKKEVVGFAGLLGSGRSETARLLSGIDRKNSGNLTIDGEKVDFTQPLDAIRKSIAFCPEDRKIDGIIGDLSVRENIILALQVKQGIGRYLKHSEQQKLADQYIKKLNIKCSSPEQLVKNLSGGNQQKVILARWLVTNPDLLILDEPTRGIDVGTKTEIQNLINTLCDDAGMSVVFISSELEEMLSCCNRMVVFKDHRKISELIGEDLNEGKIMETIAGGSFDE